MSQLHTSEIRGGGAILSPWKAAVLAALASIAVIPLPSQAGDYWYEPQNEARSWDHIGAWFWAVGSPSSKLPGSADDISIGNAGVALPNYLNITNGVTAAVNTLVIGNSANRTIGVKIESGTLTAADNIKIASAANGGGELVLSNATVKLTNSTLAVRLYVGYGAGSWGVMRGWGTITGGANNANMEISRGQVIADGFGEQKTLDFGSLANVNFGGDWSADATNGWYAVNKGKVQFPRMWLKPTSKDQTLTGCCGDRTSLASPSNQVNAIHFSINGFGSTGVRYFRCALYAEDRTDVHLDSLPENKGIVGVWSMRFDDAKTYCSVENIALTFHYDPAKVRTGRRLALYRWGGSAWVKVATGAASSDRLFSVSGLSSLSQSENIGTFALVKEKNAFVIMVR